MSKNLTLRGRRAGQGWAFALTLLTLLVAIPSSRADDIDTQRFLPRATSGGYFVTEGTDVRHPLDPFSLGLWLSYGHNPLIAVQDGEVVEQIIGHQLAFDLTASYSFATWFELGMHAPLAYLSGDDVSEGAIGDLRLLPKFRLLDDKTKAVGLALLADVRLPTHTSNFYGGARLPAFAPRLLLDHRFGLSGFRMGLDFGALLRKATEYRNVDAASEIQAGVGLGYRFDGGQSPVEIMLDMRSFVGLKDTDAEEIGLEGLLGGSVDVARDWKINAGGGLGLLEGFGVPTARGFVGVRWEPSPNDPDHDGLRSAEPKKDETIVPGEESSEAGGTGDDRSKEAPPGAANDASAAEDDGSEEPASVDDVDNAAREAAIRGGYDACPDLPEDLDGIEDEDGCPEGDIDRDGVLDYLDRCPDEAETINGYKDDDGCADEGPAQIVVEQGRLVILETIRFEPNSSKIDRSSHRILDQIALTIRAHDEIQGLEIGGHTDSTGSRGLNLRLSRERARSVRLYLLEQGGLKPSRVHARGYGPDKPIGDNNTEDGKAQNRRVEFLFVQ